MISSEIPLVFSSRRKAKCVHVFFAATVLHCYILHNITSTKPEYSSKIFLTRFMT